MAERVQLAAKTSKAKENSASTTLKIESPQSMSSPADQVLHLQRNIGNQAVQRLIKSGALQAKLRIGQPGDKYEQEADRVAEAVMRMPEPQVRRQPIGEEEEEQVQPKPVTRQFTPLVQRQVEEEEDEKLQKKGASGSTPKVTPEFESHINATRGGGESIHEEELGVEERGSDTDIDLKRKPVFGSTDYPTEEEPVMAKSELGTLQVSSDLQQKLNNSKGSGRTLTKDTRSSFESVLGADFSTVNIHTGTDAIEMNKDLDAEAFTHGSDIYFNAGKYDPTSSSGKHLLAHELTHTVQQGGSTLLTKKQTGKTEGEYSKSGAPNVQAAWYNVSIPFTDYEFDPSIKGVKNAANIAKDTVVDSAVWVKDKAVGAFEWIFDKIKGLISSGIDWLNGKFSEIKEFATSSFDTVRNSLSNLLGYITSPVSIIMSAFNNLDADLLGTAWNALNSGAVLVWKGIKSVVDGVFKIGTGIWNTISDYVSSLFGTVSSLINSWPFRQLPDFIQRKAKNLFNGIRSLWRRIRDFISGTLKRLKAFTDRILQSIESFVKNVLSYAIQKVIETVRAIKKAWVFVKKVADDPEGFIRPIVDQLAAKLNAQAPPKAIELGHQKVQENFKGDQSSSVGNGIIQRQALTTKPKRSTASSDKVDLGIITAIKTAWADLDIGKMLWETIVNMFWPPATIRAIGHEFSELWSTDWANTVNSFFMPRNILKEPAGFFHDVWSNILVFLDFPLALWRRLNSVFMLLLGYLTIILVIIGAVAGGIAGAAAGGAGAIPGALAGAAAGLELAGAIGLVLLVSYFAAEGISVLKWILELRTARQTQNEKDRDYVQIAGSLIGMAVAAVLVAILWFLSQLVSAIVRGIKAGVKTAPPKATPKAKPPEVKPPEAKPPRKKPPEETPEVKVPKTKEKIRTPEEIAQRKIELSKDPQTGKPNSKSISERDSILQAEREGIVENSRRPDLDKGEPNLDFVVEGPEPFKFADVKTPVNRGNLNAQAESIGNKSFLQKGGSNDVVHIIDLKNIPPEAKANFAKGVIKGANEAAGGKGSADGIVFINK